MLNPFRKARAEPIVRAAAESDQAPDADWIEKVERLSELVEYRVSATCIAMLGTAMLAKALNAEVNLATFKPEHVEPQDLPRAYSARTLCHSTLVPLAAEYGFNLGVTGREPLNNQPFFRMKRLDDGTPVNAKAARAVAYLLELVGELQALPDCQSAARTLQAFITVRRRHAPVYEVASGTAKLSPLGLLDAICEFMSLGSAGGSHAQAVAAGLMDAVYGTEMVESGRINDPSRHYPGDVCVWAKRPKEKTVAKAIEVRDKPVAASDVHIFVRRCQADRVRDCAILMVAQNQPELDQAALASWADRLGISTILWRGWREFAHQLLFWASAPADIVAGKAVPFIRERLILAEVSNAALAEWDRLTLDGQSIDD